jgi:hypothetical protein
MRNSFTNLLNILASKYLAASVFLSFVHTIPISLNIGLNPALFWDIVMQAIVV